MAQATRGGIPGKVFDDAAVAMPGVAVTLGSALELNVLLDIFSVFNNLGETQRDIQYTTAVDGQTYNVLD